MLRTTFSGRSTSSFEELFEGNGGPLLPLAHAPVDMSKGLVDMSSNISDNPVCCVMSCGLRSRCYRSAFVSSRFSMVYMTRCQTSSSSFSAGLVISFARRHRHHLAGFQPHRPSPEKFDAEHGVGDKLLYQWLPFEPVGQIQCCRPHFSAGRWRWREDGREGRGALPGNPPHFGSSRSTPRPSVAGSVSCRPRTTCDG